MKDHTVSIDKSGGETRLNFSPVFNAAMAFIDRQQVTGEPERPFLRTFEGETVTFAMLSENVNRCGNLLIDSGIAPGERLLMVVQDGSEFLYLFWGAIKAGIIPVPLNTLFRRDDFHYLLENSEATGIAYSEATAAEVEPAIRSAAQRPRFVLKLETGERSLAARLRQASPELEPFPSAPDSDCFWLYSSGSTGKPKGASHLHRSMVVTSQYVGADFLGFGKDDVIFSASKMFFAYGLGNTITSPLWVGGSSVVTAAWPTPALIFDVIEKFRPTVFFSVPTLYAALLKSLEETPRDLSSLRMCISSGEALPPELFNRWQERTGQLLMEVMGTTETCYCIIGNRPDAFKPGYSGQVIPGQEVRIVDENLDEVAQGEPGQLLVKTQAAARGYWKNPEKTAQTMLEGGWLNTGDTFTRDENGFFLCKGRNDDMLKISGIWCSPLEIEAKLIEHPKVLETAVVQHLDRDNLIKPAAWVVLTHPSEAGPDLAEELLGLCKESLASYKYPRWFNFLEELPKTATGKIQRVKLRDRPIDSSATTGSAGKS